jgi:hypothetical protein
LTPEREAEGNVRPRQRFEFLLLDDRKRLAGVVLRSGQFHGRVRGL